MPSKGIFSVYIVIYGVMHNDVKIFNVSYTKQKQRLNEKSKGDSLTACYKCPLDFVRNSKAGRGMGSLYSGTKGRLEVCPV